MKIVVTGATGFIGTRLVQHLLVAGHAVTALSRSAAQAARRLPVRCTVQEWNPAGPLDPTILRGVDAVVHLAGEGVADGRWTAARKRAIRESRVAGTRTIVQAIAALPEGERPRVCVSAAAIGYYGDRGDEALDETSRPGNGFLAEVCQAWEQEVFKATALGVRSVAIRVGVVLGKQGGALAKMLPPFRLGAGGRVGSGRQWMSWIHLDDLVALFQFALEHTEVSGPLNGVAPNPATNAAFTRELARAVHRPALLPVPAVVLRVALGEMASVLLTGQRVLPRAATQLGFIFRYPDLGAALDDICHDLSHELFYEQWLPRTPEQVFPFFSDARNLEKITPALVGFRVLNISTAQLGAGTYINYRLSLHGIPMRWQSRIEEWAPNTQFVDTQTKGPYALWHHTHQFEPYNGGTIIRDRVRYALPLGALGELVGGSRVRRDLETIFEFRRAKTQELFGDT